MRESISSLSFRGGITIILNWQPAWWAVSVGGSMPEQAVERSIVYQTTQRRNMSGTFVTTELYTGTHTHTKFMYNIGLQTLKTEILYFSITLWVRNFFILFCFSIILWQWNFFILFGFGVLTVGVKFIYFLLWWQNKIQKLKTEIYFTQ